MIFKDIRQGYTVYMLSKDKGIKAYTGKVVSVSEPRFQGGQPIGSPLSSVASSLVVDVTIEANGETKTYSIPENSSVACAGSITLSTDRDGILRDVEAMKRTKEEEIKKAEKNKEDIADCDRILEDWNPAFAEKKQQEARISSLESEVKGISSMLKDFINGFNK